MKARRLRVQNNARRRTPPSGASVAKRSKGCKSLACHAKLALATASHLGPKLMARLCAWGYGVCLGNFHRSPRFCAAKRHCLFTVYHPCQAPYYALDSHKSAIVCQSLCKPFGLGNQVQSLPLFGCPWHGGASHVHLCHRAKLLMLVSQHLLC